MKNKSTEIKTPDYLTYLDNILLFIRNSFKEEVHIKILCKEIEGIDYIEYHPNLTNGSTSGDSIENFTINLSSNYSHQVKKLELALQFLKNEEYIDIDNEKQMIYILPKGIVKSYTNSFEESYTKQEYERHLRTIESEENISYLKLQNRLICIILLLSVVGAIASIIDAFSSSYQVFYK